MNNKTIKILLATAMLAVAITPAFADTAPAPIKPATQQEMNTQLAERVKQYQNIQAEEQKLQAQLQQLGVAEQQLAGAIQQAQAFGATLPTPAPPATPAAPKKP